MADATDDGAAYAVAQSVRSTVGALTSANQQLGNVQGLLSTTQSALNDVSNTMASMRDVLVKLSDSERSRRRSGPSIQAQYRSLLANVKIVHPGCELQRQDTDRRTSRARSGTFARVSTVRNESGASYGIATYVSAMFNAIAFSFGAIRSSIPSHGAGNTGAGSAVALAIHTQASYGSSTVAAMLTAGGTFIKQMNTVGTALNTVGSEVNYVNNQVSYNSDKIDALNTGLGSLVDADLAKESAQLQALQIRQQLGTQALSLANQAPQTLLSLFK